MLEKPAFIQGIFAFEGRGLECPAPFPSPVTYAVPEDKRAQTVYFRAGNSTAETITRARQHRRPSKTARQAQSEETRARVSIVLASVFRKHLNQPHYKHVASIAELMSGIPTDVDYVKKAERRSTHLLPQGTNSPGNPR